MARAGHNLDGHRQEADAYVSHHATTTSLAGLLSPSSPEYFTTVLGGADML